MKFYNYLSEDIEDYDLYKLIIKKCQPYLKDIKKIGNYEFFYSGRKNTISKQGQIKKVRSDRYPKDTPNEIHEFIDGGFYKKFGIKARSNSIFAYIGKGKQRAGAYGEPYILFPIGKYKVISSPNIEDLYMSLENIFDKVLSRTVDTDDIRSVWKNLIDSDKADFISELSKRLERGKYAVNVKNKPSFNEHMVTCNEVILIRMELENQLSLWIGDEYA